MAEQADEEGPAIVDAAQAHVDHPLVVGGSGLGHAPAQVHVHQAQPPLLAPFAQARKHLFDQVVPLRMHVVERAGHEHVDRLPAHGPAAGLARRLFTAGAHSNALQTQPIAITASTCASIIERRRRERKGREILRSRGPSLWALQDLNLRLPPCEVDSEGGGTRTCEGKTGTYRYQALPGRPARFAQVVCLVVCLVVCFGGRHWWGIILACPPSGHLPRMAFPPFPRPHGQLQGYRSRP